MQSRMRPYANQMNLSFKIVQHENLQLLFSNSFSVSTSNIIRGRIDIANAASMCEGDVVSSATSCKRIKRARLRYDWMPVHARNMLVIISVCKVSAYVYAIGTVTDKMPVSQKTFKWLLLNGENQSQRNKHTCTAACIL